MNVRSRLALAVSAAALLISTVASAATTHRLDPAASSLSFTFIQAGAKSEGRFREFDVSFVHAPGQLAASRLDVVVQVKSLDTGDRERDDILRGPDLFDVAKFPEARFNATQISKTGPDRYEALGGLTIRGITREMRVPLTFKNSVESGRSAGKMTGEFVIRRLDFGVGQGEWKSTEWVGNEVTVSFSLRLPAAAGS